MGSSVTCWFHLAALLNYQRLVNNHFSNFCIACADPQTHLTQPPYFPQEFPFARLADVSSTCSALKTFFLHFHQHCLVCAVWCMTMLLLSLHALPTMTLHEYKFHEKLIICSLYPLPRSALCLCSVAFLSFISTNSKMMR